MVIHVFNFQHEFVIIIHTLTAFVLAIFTNAHAVESTVKWSMRLSAQVWKINKVFLAIDDRYVGSH